METEDNTCSKTPVNESMSAVSLNPNPSLQDDTNLELTEPIFENGKYKNPWKTWHMNSLKNTLKFVFGKRDTGIPKKEELDRILPILKPNFENFASEQLSDVQAMWIGHASLLVHLDGITVLTDPIFSDRCSPFQFMGPKRYRDPPCTVEDLPKVDAVVISHNHYDHLDYTSVVALNRKYGNYLRWYVPMGLKKWMLDQGCENVVELSWWQEDEFPEKNDVRFACTPTQHWCKRTLTDTNKALWCSWSVLGPNHRFFFGGDTGYCEGFKQIGRKYGPFSLAAIPIGCFKPRSFLSPQHVGPDEAVQIHTDIKAKKSFGIHWGTFEMGAHEHYLEPRDCLKEEVKKANLAEDEFITLNHGEIKAFRDTDS